MKTEQMFPETMRTPRAAAVISLAFVLAMALALLSLGSQGAKPAQAAGTAFTVNSTGDVPAAGATNDGVCQTAAVGECTFRAAIEEANGTKGADTIAFNIPGSGVQLISTGSELPQITDPVTIDGYTQSGATETQRLNQA